jgi:hypothetical protein
MRDPPLESGAASEDFVEMQRIVIAAAPSKQAHMIVRHNKPEAPFGADFEVDRFRRGRICAYSQRKLTEVKLADAPDQTSTSILKAHGELLLVCEHNANAATLLVAGVRVVFRG